MRGLTLALSIFAVFAACVSGLLYFLIGNRKADLESTVEKLRQEIAALKAGSADLADERDSIASRAATTEREINELKARNITLEARNSQLARDVTEVREQLGARERSEKVATEETERLRKDLVEARAALAAASTAAANEEIAKLNARIADLEGELSFLRQSSGGGRSLADALARVPETLSGSVLEVGPKAGFVVLNIGTRNGAVPTLEMVVRRGSTIVARVRLTDVRESYSVAYVLPSSGSGNIRAGDSATRS